MKKIQNYYISYPTIYRYIRNGLVKVDVKRDMRQAGKKYNKSSEKRGKLDVGSRVIKYRLKSINNREEFGHYEIDTVWSVRPSTYCLLTIIERKTRYLYASRLNTRKSNVVCNEIINIMKPLLPKSITMDRGKEFALLNK